jgi:hypothetical protein
MKKLLTLIGATAAAGMMVISAPAATIATLSNGQLDPGEVAIDQIQIGDKIFADFSWATTVNVAPSIGTPVGAAGIAVTLVNSGPNYAIQFQGAISSGLGGDVDYALKYTVRTSSGAAIIQAIDQSFTLSAQGNGGVVNIGETVRNGGFGGTTVAQSSVGFAVTGDMEDPPGEVAQGDQLLINPWLSKIWISKDLHMIAADDGSIAGATIVEQSFHQFPDGGSTLVLLGSALGALSLLRLRRKH